jgi:hypothetical protein
MQAATEGSILRERLATAGRKGAGKPFPDDLRRAVVDYAARKLKAGCTVESVARELGISAMSVARWTQRFEKAPEAGLMRRVEVLAETAVPSSGLVVHTPSGLRIEGLDLGRLVQLVRAVG